MRILITAGPTREPIDPVRFISNHSSGRLGLALINAALKKEHHVTAILGPVAYPTPGRATRVDVETTRQMYDAVMREFPSHDLLIMAAAVADYRPRIATDTKIGREGRLTLELEPTEDIVAAAATNKRPNQRIIGFSLEAEGDISRARAKLDRKRLDMIVFNPLRTMNAPTIRPTLLYPDGRINELSEASKEAFAALLIEKAVELLAGNPTA